jgi:hypothetical protein
MRSSSSQGLGGIHGEFASDELHSSHQRQLATEAPGLISIPGMHANCARSVNSKPDFLNAFNMMENEDHAVALLAGAQNGNTTTLGMGMRWLIPAAASSPDGTQCHPVLRV